MNIEMTLSGNEEETSFVMNELRKSTCFKTLKPENLFLGSVVKESNINYTLDGKVYKIKLEIVPVKEILY